ncbi:MAG: hypothetical protein JSS66_05730 [Armatimonadetes bacterium]|nr:hypothetical protein [Armatimonadota bacterium]
MTHVFTCKEHEDFGTNGWVLDAKPYFDPGDGQLVAHDVLEEFPHSGEQPHHELLAMGAMVFGRCSSGMIGSSIFSPGAVIANEYLEMLRHVFEEDGYWLEPAKQQRPLFDEYAETTICQFLEAAPGVLQSEYSDGNENPEQLAKALAYLPDAANWMRLGFRMAHKRYYPHLDGYDVAMLFERLKNAVNKIRDIELGDKLKIRMSYRRHDFTLAHVPAYELAEW